MDKLTKYELDMITELLGGVLMESPLTQLDRERIGDILGKLTEKPKPSGNRATTLKENKEAIAWQEPLWEEHYGELDPYTSKAPKETWDTLKSKLSIEELSQVYTSREWLLYAEELEKAPVLFDEVERGSVEFLGSKPTVITLSQATPEDKDSYIIEQYMKGEAVAHICERVGRSAGYVYTVLNKNGVPKREAKSQTKLYNRVKHIVESPNLVQQVINDYNNKVPLAVIYERYNLHKNGLYYILDTNNVKRHTIKRHD